MEIKVKSYSTQGSLISSIIFLIIGGVLITYADSVKKFISIGIGTLLAVISVVSLVIYYLSRRKEDNIPNKEDSSIDKLEEEYLLNKMSSSFL